MSRVHPNVTPVTSIGYMVTSRWRRCGAFETTLHLFRTEGKSGGGSMLTKSFYAVFMLPDFHFL